MRNQQCCQGFGQPGEVLGHVDERHRQVPRRVQDGESERACKDDVAGRDFAALPERDGPGQEADRQRDRDQGVQDAQLLEIEQAAPTRRQLAIDRQIEAAPLAPEAAKRPDQTACC